MKLPTRVASALGAVTIFATSPFATAQSVTLQAIQDNTLYESTTGDLSNGAGSSGFSGGNAAAGKRRYLVQFDIAAAVPANANIIAATLTIHCTGVPPGAMPDTHGLHRMLGVWGEGTSNGGGQGAPSSTGDATWIHSEYPATLWTTPGGDFEASPSATFPMHSIGPVAISSSPLILEVQDMLTQPATNFGWMVKAAGEIAHSSRQLASRENATPNLRPTLHLTYSVPSMNTFCDPNNDNSAGRPVVLSGYFGSGYGSDLHLDVTGGPLPLADGSRMLGYFLVGDAPLFGLPISDGLFCLAGGMPSFFTRYNIAGTNRMSVGLFDAAGNFENLSGTGGPTGYGFDVPSEIDLWGYGPMIVAGDSLHFQFWYRDTLSGPGRSNFSNGLSVTF